MLPTLAYRRPIGRRLSEIDPEIERPLVPGIAYRDKLTFVAGREGFGKSTLLRQIVAAVTVGGDWLASGRGPVSLDPARFGEPEPVLWCGEEGPAKLRRDLERAGADCGLVVVAAPEDIARPADLTAAVDEWQPALVVVDPLADLLRLEDERSYSAVRQSVRTWFRASWVPAEGERHAPAVVGVLHSHRDRDARAGGGDQVGAYLGSVGFGSSCDLMLELLLVERGNVGNPRRSLRVCKSRIDGVTGGTARGLDFAGGRYRPVAVDVAPAGSTAERSRLVQIARDAARLRGEGLTKTAAARQLGLSRGGSAPYRTFSQAWNSVGSECS